LIKRNELLELNLIVSCLRDFGNEFSDFRFSRIQTQSSQNISQAGCLYFPITSGFKKGKRLLKFVHLIFRKPRHDGVIAGVVVVVDVVVVVVVMVVVFVVVVALIRLSNSIKETVITNQRNL